MAAEQDSWKRLGEAMLRAADLGPDFQEQGRDDGPLSMRESGEVLHMLVREATNELVMLAFSPYSVASVRQLAIAQTYWAWNPRNPDRPEIGDVAPPSFGEDGVGFRWHTEVDGQNRGGHLLAWRYGDLVVSVVVTRSGEPDALPYAVKQQEKLTALFPQPLEVPLEDAAVDPIVQVVCPESHPIKGVRHAEGMPFYLKPYDADYDDAVPERCFRSDAAAQRAGYTRRLDEPPRLIMD